MTVGGTINDDSLKYDIFSQAAQAILHPEGVDPLAGLPGPRVLIATGDTRLRDPLTGGPLPTARPLFIRQNGGPRLIGKGDCS